MTRLPDNFHLDEWEASQISWQLVQFGTGEAKKTFKIYTFTCRKSSPPARVQAAH